VSPFSSLRPAGRLAASNLFEEKLRLGLSVLGVALSVMLILILLGLRAGVYKGVRAYLENSPGSIVVLPKGTRTTFAVAGKQLPPGTTEAVSRVDGVARVTPLLRMGSIPDLHGKKEYVVLVGYDRALGGGPWELASGREPAADNEVVLDRVLAERHGYSVGQTLTLAGQALTVVGLSSGTNSWVGTYVFATKTFVEKLVLVPGATNVLLVNPTSGTRTSNLVGRLAAIPDVSVLSKDQVIDGDQKVIAGVFNQVLSVMVIAAFLVGTLVVGVVIYTATIERRREYGVLRALGARSSTL
jgi:putative ABC transport system permease protein